MFYPSYRLCVVSISSNPDGVAVEYEGIPKSSPSAEEVTLTERPLTLGREPTPELPGRSVVDEVPEPATDTSD